MLRGSISSILLLTRHDLLFLMLHYVVVRLDENEDDIVCDVKFSDVAAITSYDVLLFILH